MKILSLVVSVLTALSTLAHGTKVPHIPLAELVAKSDYIVVGKVVKVDIVDVEGRQVTDPNARTGPGFRNTIRLHVVVERGSTIKGDRKLIPKKIIVPEYSSLHHRFKTQKDLAEGKVFIFLLKGTDFSPVSVPHSVRPMTERAEIEKLVK